MPLPPVKFLNTCPVSDVTLSDTIISEIPNVENNILRSLILLKAEDEHPVDSTSIPRIKCDRGVIDFHPASSVICAGDGSRSATTRSNQRVRLG